MKNLSDHRTATKVSLRSNRTRSKVRKNRVFRERKFFIGLLRTLWFATGLLHCSMERCESATHRARNPTEFAKRKGLRFVESWS